MGEGCFQIQLHTPDPSATHPQTPRPTAHSPVVSLDRLDTTSRGDSGDEGESWREFGVSKGGWGRLAQEGLGVGGRWRHSELAEREERRRLAREGASGQAEEELGRGSGGRSGGKAEERATGEKTYRGRREPPGGTGAPREGSRGKAVGTAGLERPLQFQTAGAPPPLPERPFAPRAGSLVPGTRTWEPARRAGRRRRAAGRAAARRWLRRV